MSVSYISKIKFKYLIFFVLILNLLVIGAVMKVGKVKDRPLTTIYFSCRSEKAVILFLKNFIYLHFPSMDSFLSKLILKKVGHSSVNFSLLKFPSIIEADLLLASMEELLTVYNLTRINFTLMFCTYPYKLDFLAFGHLNRIPILL